MLLHALVPHHHLSDRICILQRTPRDFSAPIHSGDGCCRHGSTPESKDDRCLLGQVTILPANDNKTPGLRISNLQCTDYSFESAWLVSDLLKHALEFGTGVKVNSGPLILLIKVFPFSFIGSRAPPQI
jgi:hypothetical protein